MTQLAHVPDCQCSFCSKPRPAEYRAPEWTTADLIEAFDDPDLTRHTIRMYGWNSQTGALTMLAFIKKYAKAIVAAIGYAASIATALGLTHYHWVSIVLGVLSTIAVIITKNTIPAAKPHAASPAPDRG